MVSIGTIQKTKNKTLTKESFIKIFKFTGDLARIKSKEIKKTAQAERVAAFNVSPKKYLELLKKSINDEENAYERSSQELFERLSISPEFFERS